MSKISPAARASSAASKVTETKQELARHRKHRQAHATIALAGGALLGGAPSGPRNALVDETVREHDSSLPLTPKETAAVDSLVSDHEIAPSLTRRDPGETGPVLAQFGDDTYQIDGGTVTKLKAAS